MNPFKQTRGMDHFWYGIALMLPRKLVYWCGIRLLTHATAGKYSYQVVPELTVLKALKRWEINNETP